MINTEPDLRRREQRGYEDGKQDARIVHEYDRERILAAMERCEDNIERNRFIGARSNVRYYEGKTRGLLAVLELPND